MSKINGFDREIIIGIDLGTTNSCVGICRNKKVEIIGSGYSDCITPSYVAFTEEGQRLVGKAAKDQLIRNPQRTIYNIKRLIGRTWNDETVQEEIKNVSFQVVEKDSLPYIQIQTKKIGGLKEEKTRLFGTEDISGMILGKLKKLAEEYLNEKVSKAVITVPAYFTNAQRQATINAGSKAGLNVVKILNEPTAAAMAYGINEMNDTRIIVLYDLGGGTFDVSIMKIENKNFTVLATCGNTHLGGEDFDRNVVKHFINLYKRKNKDFSNNSRACAKLRREVEIAKRTLTHQASTEIVIGNMFDDDDFVETLTRAKFEDLNKKLFLDTLKSVQQALDDAKLTKKDVNEIVMVGGSSRIPKIRELVTCFFDGKEPLLKINPDEAVAYGAAIQAGILSGQEDSMALFDVNPLSLGIENSDNTISVIIPRNTILPVTKTQMRTTSEDYQTAAEFSVYEGELPLAKDNLFLGEFKLTSIERAVKGVPRFETIFRIDENGILHVSAEDEKTKAKMAISINWQQKRPTKEQIENMLKISEEYDKLDELFNASVNSRIEYSEMVYSIQDNIERNNLTDFQKDKLKLIVAEHKIWLENNKICEIDVYKKRKEALEKDIKAYM